jgi:transposase InsO family protein
MEKCIQLNKLHQGSNYPIWRKLIKLQLASKEIGIESDNPGKAAKAIFCIFNNIDENFLHYVINSKTPKDIFEKLDIIFNYNVEKESQLKVIEFFNYKYTGNLLLDISKLQNMSFDLESTENKITEGMLIQKILTILPSNLNYFRTVWEITSKSDQTVLKLIERLQKEIKLLGNDDFNDNSDFNIQEIAMKSNERKCYSCNLPGHIARFCKNKKCTVCNRSGHRSEECFSTKICRKCNKKGHIEKFCRTFSLVSEQNNHLIKINAILDSGASSHMFYNSNIINFTEKINTEIKCANAENLVAQARGTINTNTFKLEDVLYVPAISRNLISVSAITDHGASVLFTENKVTVSKNNLIILTGYKTPNGLFETEFNAKAASEAMLSENAHIWHRRLAHVSDVLRLAKMVNGIKIGGDHKESFCETCVQAKMTRKPFKNNRTKAKFPLEIIHTDVCGPIEVPTWDNKKYFVTFLDDFTHFCVVYLISFKSEVFDKVKLFISLAENHFNKKVRKIRCDNGREYLNNNLMSLTKTKGIVLDVTVPYTPQLNGKAERLNRTLLQKTRALIFDGRVPNYLWGEALLTASFLTNRSPTEGKDKTPAELWFGVKPDVSHVKTFGSTAYYKINSGLRKLDARCTKGILIGYVSNSYKIWVDETKTIVRARDVRINENEQGIYLNEQNNEDIRGLWYIDENNKESVREDTPENREVNRREQNRGGRVRNNEGREGESLRNNEGREGESLRNNEGREGERFINNDGREGETRRIRSRSIESIRVGDVRMKILNIETSEDETNESGTNEDGTNEVETNDVRTNDVRTNDVGTNEVVINEEEINDSEKNEIVYEQESNEEYFDGDENLQPIDIQINENRSESHENRNHNNENRRILPLRERRLPDRYKDYLMDYDTEVSMLTYEEAIESREKGKWKQAIEEEIGSLEENNTWSFVNEQEAKGRKLVTTKWIFTVKSDGRYKARLVARGFQQKYKIDYDETYSPVVNTTSLRILISIAAAKGLKMKQFDVKTAFLHGDLKETIYMKVPKGYLNKEGKVCKLNKSLYGLKQAPLMWNIKFTEFLSKMGFKQMKLDQCIFVMEGEKKIILAIYVDDGLLFGEREEDLIHVMDTIRKTFEIRILDEVTNYIGLDIEQDDKGIKIFQKNYSEKIVKKFNLENARECRTPNITIEEHPSVKVDMKSHELYREMIGSLLYLANKSRPDISFQVGYCSRHQNSPNLNDLNNAKTIFRFVKGTTEKGIHFGKDDKVLRGYCDSDFAGDPDTRRSTSGFVIWLNGGPVAWSSRKQSVVALSSTEAEFIAAAECCKELLFVRDLIYEITKERLEVEMRVDNQSAIWLMKKGIMGRRSKHIDVKYYYLKEKIDENQISVKYCPTGSQLADILTKSLPAVKFEKCQKRLVC